MHRRSNADGVAPRAASLLRICTAGSVDDGKSTLLGRMLYDAKAVYDDHVRSVEVASRNRTAGPIDFSLFTDGLKAEREQGITIDVAYRYFATSRRSFILADTPGHEQYTRNMATGASTADLAVLLVDARHGLREQSRRHARIARLLGISHFVVAVNKMDLVEFNRQVFEAIRDDFAALLGDASIHAIPMSALHGDNVTFGSERTPWFDGPSLLEHLECVDVERDTSTQPFRFPVQLVIRPHDGFRGYAGQIAAGAIRPGDPVTVLPSGATSRVHRIVTWDGDLEVAHAPMSVTLVLADDVDISRGDLLAAGHIDVTSRFTADLIWMDTRPLDPGRVYLLKQATRTSTAEVDRGLELNEIGRVAVTTSRPLAVDRYTANRTTGSFILVDPTTSFTAGAGMVVDPMPERDERSPALSVAVRLAQIARRAPSDEAAADAIRRTLEEIL